MLLYKETLKVAIMPILIRRTKSDYFHSHSIFRAQSISRYLENAETAITINILDNGVIFIYIKIRLQ
jgi:hypothetical protein